MSTTIRVDALTGSKEYYIVSSAYPTINYNQLAYLRADRNLSGTDSMAFKVAFPADYEATPIESASIGVYIASDGSLANEEWFTYGYYSGTWNDWFPSYNDISSGLMTYMRSRIITATDMNKYVEVPLDYSYDIERVFKNGASVSNFLYGGKIATPALDSTHIPYVKIVFSDTPVGFTVYGTTSIGFKEAETKISWSMYRTTSEYIFGTLKQKSAVLTWRNSGSTVEHTINVQGEQQFCTVPAGTFLANEIEYKITVTSNGNGVETSEWKTLTTKGVYLDGLSPTSGYASERDLVMFGWNIKQDGDPTAVVNQQSATLIYKNSPDDTEHTISVGATKYCIVRPPTFTGDVIIWKVRAVAEHGTAAESEWYTLTTIEETSRADIISPIGVAVDSTKPVLFKWQHIIGTGTITFGFDIQTSTNGSTWTQFAHDERGDIMQDGRDLNRYEAPAGTLSATVKFWRVRTYNTDMLPGSWSEPATIIVIGAPDAPGIFVIDSSPKWKIRWTQEGQQGYEIQFDGATLKKGYSLESNYTYDGYAEDGDHEIKVRIQNEYGLWSAWATAAINIQNDPGEPVVLTATVSPDAPEVNLVAAGGDGDSYIYYRDGIEIGRTDQPTFTDRFAIGRATYSVFVTYADSGNYSASDGVEADVSVKVPWLYSAKTKQWVPLRMSEKETNGLGQSYSITAAFLHFAGSDKPSVEYGISSDRSMSFSAGFLNDSEDLQKFLAMVGGTVCAKWPDGDMIIGAMFNWERAHGRIYTEFSTKIIETEFDEVAENG